MSHKFRYISSFEAEDIVPGDVLMSKLNNSIAYSVINVNADSDEYLVLSIGRQGRVFELVSRIGFEDIEEYRKVIIYDAGY